MHSHDHAHGHDHHEAHGHDHAHDHVHEQDAEKAQLGPTYDGTVVLDIGGDVGALILLTGADLVLTEPEISRVDGRPPLVDGGGYVPHSAGNADEGPVVLRTHVAVRERRGPDGVRYAAIYPNLYTGEYTVFGPDGRPRDTVTVNGGQVAELDWR